VRPRGVDRSALPPDGRKKILQQASRQCVGPGSSRQNRRCPGAIAVNHYMPHNPRGGSDPAPLPKSSPQAARRWRRCRFTAQSRRDDHRADHSSHGLGQAYRQRVSADLLVHTAHPLNTETPLPALIGADVTPHWPRRRRASGGVLALRAPPRGPVSNWSTSSIRRAWQPTRARWCSGALTAGTSTGAPKPYSLSAAWGRRRF
jgi:hypothetical protein